MLRLEHVSIAYHDKQVVENLSLQISSGEILGIVGESGSGKSTMLKSILGLLGGGGRIIQGRILLDGKELQNLTDKELQKIRGKDIAFIFQHPELSFDPTVKIRKQFFEAARMHGMTSKQEVKDRVLNLMERMHFEDPERVLDAYPFELSGGMCQRVAIALAMLHQPRILLADEPTSALDVTIQAQVVEQLMQLRKETNTAILIVTHNMGVAAHMSDQIGVMQKGKMVEYGTCQQVLYSPTHAYTKSLIAAIPKMDGSLPAKGTQT